MIRCAKAWRTTMPFEITSVTLRDTRPDLSARGARDVSVTAWDPTSRASVHIAFPLAGAEGASDNELRVRAREQAASLMGLASDAFNHAESGVA